jgi:hypothetical protein
MNCHGLGFSIDALADPALIKANFRGQARMHIRSLDMVQDRIDARAKKRPSNREASAENK